MGRPGDGGRVTRGRKGKSDFPSRQVDFPGTPSPRQLDQIFERAVDVRPPRPSTSPLRAAYTVGTGPKR
eukprot:3904975-Prymnesium_polylepis.1